MSQRMVFGRCAPWSFFAIVLMVVPVRAQPEKVSPAPRVVPDLPSVSLTISPARLPVPVLRYRLLTNFPDQIPGDAAVSYYRAMMLLSESTGDKKSMELSQKIEDQFQKPIKDWPVDDLRTFLQSYRNVFVELEFGVKREHCNWDLERRLDSGGIGVLIPELQRLRELARLLKFRCRLHIAEGKLDEALHDVKMGFTMGRHVAEGPTLIHALVSMALLNIFSGELDQIIQQPGSPNLYWALTSLPRPLVDLRKALEGEIRMTNGTLPMLNEIEKRPMSTEEIERVFDRWTLSIIGLGGRDNSYELQQPFMQSKLTKALFLTLQYPHARKSLLALGKTEKELDAMPAVQVVMLDAVLRFKNLRDQVFAWFALPYSEAREGMMRSDVMIEQIRQEAKADLLGPWLVQLLPAMQKVHFAVARTDRKIAALRVVEAIRLHAAANGGNMPTKLQDIREVPIPKDPVTDKPFEYAVKDGIAQLYGPPPEGEKANVNNVVLYEITIRVNKN